MPNFGRRVQKLKMGAGVNKSDACCSHRKLINKFLSATGLPVPVARYRILVRHRCKVCAGHCSAASHTAGRGWLGGTRIGAGVVGLMVRGSELPHTESVGARHRKRRGFILLYMKTKNLDCMSLDAGSRCHGRSFSMDKRNG